MASIKVLLAGLTVVSLCMANISGIVTDTGTTPIAGAVVQLEKGGHKDTTEANGSFTLDVGSTGILPVNGKLSPNGLSAGISGTLMTVTILEQSAVEVATFDLNGKAIANVRQTMDAGNHSILLPQRGAGIYLYKVKSGNRELVLKGNTVGGISSGSSVTTQGSSSNHLVKQALNSSAINDVIVATKVGYLNYRVVAYNSDSAGTAIKMIASAGTLTDADRNEYQTVKIGNQVWMTENLRVTKYNDGSAIPLVTDSAAWCRIYDSKLTTPAFCFYNNTTNPDSIKKYGALYNWYVVSPANLKKIAPTGWHVPSDAEWDTLQNCLITKGYNWDGTITGNMIAKSLAAKTDWYTNSTAGSIGSDLTRNNSSGFSALPGDSRLYNGRFLKASHGCWWSTMESNVTHVWFRNLAYFDISLCRDSYYKSCGFSVRLVRD